MVVKLDKPVYYIVVTKLLVVIFEILSSVVCLHLFAESWEKSTFVSSFSIARPQLILSNFHWTGFCSLCYASALQILSTQNCLFR